MRAYTGFFLGVFFLTLFLVTSDGYSQTCPNPVMLGFDSSSYTSVQSAYDTATYPQVLNLTDFTLRIATDGLLEENVIFDQEATVTLEGGWDCLFSTRNNNVSSTISGTLIISGGTVITSNIALTAGPLCQPGDPNNFPGNPEICDGADNNCNGLIDDGLTFDIDGDGSTAIGSCAGTADDCDDNDPNNFPGNPEICDLADNNCDGQADEGLTATDADMDGYSAVGSCGGSANDCNDNNPNINPGAIEIFGDGIDQDCDGEDVLPSEVQCFGCHPFTWVDTIHQRDITPDNFCIDCHGARAVSVRGGHYGQTVLTPGNNLPAGHQIRCKTCHDRHADENGDPFEEANGFYFIDANFVWPKVTAAGTTTNPTPPPVIIRDITCYTCHETLSTDHESAAAHNNRVIDPLCANCHTSDTSVLGQPGTGTLVSDADINALHTFDGDECLHCHAYTGTAPDADIVEQAIIGGFVGYPISCLDCHEVEFPVIHAFIENHNLLINVGSTGCGNCHSDPPPLTDAADPKVHNACFSCHDANYNRISLAYGKTFAAGGDCTTCHEDPFDTFHPQNVNHTALVTVGLTSCGNCHADSPLIDPLDPKVHNSCSSCHDAEGSLISLAYGKTFTAGGNCATCHTDPFDTVHPPDTDHSGIVNTTGTQCGTCHTGTLLIDPSDPKVHNGCSTCHDTDGGLIGLASGKSAPGNCNTCHGADFTTIHPDTIDHSAIVNVSTTSCGNCHSNPPPLVDPIDPKVHNGCSSCHDTNGGLISRAAGKSFAGGGDCSTCHDETFTAIHAGGSNLIQGHSDIITITGTQCGSCHSNPPPLVEPTDPMVHDSCSTCHDGSGGLIDLASGATVPGNCNTCHGADFTTIHPDTIDHSAIVKVGTTSCGNCHSNPPPLVAPTDPKVHNECLSCHDTDGVLQGRAFGKSFAAGGTCATCHTEAFDTIHPADVDHSFAIQISYDCDSCHDAPPPVVDPNDPKVHNECSSCHDAEGALKSIASGNTAPNECIDCHGNDLGTLHQNLSIDHNASPGSDNVILFEAGQHDSAMIGDGTVYIACSTCHSTNLGNVHDNNCATCHSGSPSAYDELGSFWLGGCLKVDGQPNSGCHTVYHEDATAGHNSVVDYDTETNCTVCHNPTTWLIPTTSCATCHATNYGPSDTTPPVTTSDALPFYVIPALIKFTIKDNGGKVGIGTTYSRLNGGPLHIGTSLLVEQNGNHTLEFWTVDQAGNEELPHNFVNFTVNNDTTPPVTTSNAQSNYETDAYITLTATDDNHADIITTSYILDSGQIQEFQEGTFIHVPEQDGTFSHTLEFWSVDWTGNEETHKFANFTIHGGTGTLRLVWGSSDTVGSPCGAEPNAAADWTVRKNNEFGPIIAQGSNGCPGWSGVDDVIVDVSQTPYHVRIDWWNSDIEGFDQTDHANVSVYPHGDLDRLQY